MPDLEKKISILSKSILDEAEKEREKLISDIRERKNSAVTEKENELLSDAYDDIQKTVTKYSKENNERILKVEMDLKKGLIKKREQMIEEIFLEVSKRLEEFCESPQYKDWLIKAAGLAVSQTGNGEIHLLKKDGKYKDDIADAFPDCSVTADADDSLIGGVTSVNKNIASDCTIKEKLEEQRVNFLKTSALSIKI